MTSSSAPTCEPTKLKPGILPQWKILLHDDDIEAEHVVEKVQEIAKLSEEDAVKRVMEAHENKIALLLITHQEKAEFLVEMFDSCMPKITVTMEKT